MTDYKFEHVGITVNSIEETAKWYETNLGFKRGEIIDKPGLELRLCKIGLDKFCLEVLEPYEKKYFLKESNDVVELFSRPGLNHMAFCVSDLNESYRRMMENGVQIITSIIDSKYFLCRDNNGISLEIKQAK